MQVLLQKRGPASSKLTKFCPDLYWPFVDINVNIVAYAWFTNDVIHRTDLRWCQYLAYYPIMVFPCMAVLLPVGVIAVCMVRADAVNYGGSCKRAPFSLLFFKEEPYDQIYIIH